MSASTTSTRRESWAKDTARLIAVTVLPSRGWLLVTRRVRGGFCGLKESTLVRIPRYASAGGVAPNSRRRGRGVRTGGRVPPRFRAGMRRGPAARRSWSGTTPRVGSSRSWRTSSGVLSEPSTFSSAKQSASPSPPPSRRPKARLNGTAGWGGTAGGRHRRAPRGVDPRRVGELHPLHDVCLLQALEERPVEVARGVHGLVELDVLPGDILQIEDRVLLELELLAQLLLLPLGGEIRRLDPAHGS